MGEEMMYVTVGEDAAENRSILTWVLQNAKGKQVCTIHVHQPSSTPKKENSFEENAREETHYEEFQYFYHQSEWAGIEELYIEADSIEKGIIQLIEQHNIGRLVMGAAADEHYSRTMMSVRSKKAVYVMDNAPLSCHIWFICKGYLIQSCQKQPIRDSLESSAGKNEPVRAESNEGAGSPTAPSRNESESIINEHYYDPLELAMTEAENSRGVFFEESIRRREAEKEALVDAICKADMAERLYDEELRLRKATEEELAVRKEELRETTVEKFSLQNLIEKSNLSLKESQDKLFSGQKLLQQYTNENTELKKSLLSMVEVTEKYKNKQDELQIAMDKALKKAKKERNKALKEAESLRKELARSPSTSHVPVSFSVFSFSDLEKATKNFDPNLKIGEGGYGSIYKGFLRHTEVAIKILDPNSMQGPREFDQEVAVLSKMRHPNMVTLVGACLESWALVYEYLSGGSLEDRLICKNNTLPLPWQIRIRIATELCTALIFLHTSRPGCIIHGDLKPANVLLDENCVCKLSDFGICRVVTHGQTSMEHTTLFFTTEPKGTFTYMDPEFLSTGELTPKSDVYSFGIILLQLLTGKSALGITKKVESALAKGTLDTLLDPSAGDWPFVQAKQLARMALRCCDTKRKNRPDLGSDVWRVLEPMKSSCQNLPMVRLTSDDQVPNYFNCPIFQEIMEDPQIASDGFTYEAEAIRGWLDSGHDSSPMTNVTLANHNLVPNRALRSAIQEWLQHNRSE